MTPSETPRRPRRAWLAGLIAGLALTASPGCATVAGLVSGAFTGIVDAPAQVYRAKAGTFERHPEYWPFNLAFFSPVGSFFGPFAGLAKGIALDVQWLFLDDTVSYEKIFASYREASIWRPYTIHW